MFLPQWAQKEFDNHPSSCALITAQAQKWDPNFEGAHITAFTNVLKYSYAQKSLGMLRINSSILTNINKIAKETDTRRHIANKL